MLASDVIQQLNEAYSNGGLGFLNLDVFYPVDVRLSAFRDDQSWALLIESVCFNDGPGGHEGMCTMLYAYGDDLPASPGRAGKLRVTGDGPSGPLFDPTDVLNCAISPAAKDMKIRDKVVNIVTDPSAYAEAGIELREPPSVLAYELLRMVVPMHRRSFFATSAEVVERIGRPMPLLLVLNEWRHPDWTKEEMPADSESFQLIAEVLQTGEPERYRPTEPPNTHWRNWPYASII